MPNHNSSAGLSGRLTSERQRLRLSQAEMAKKTGRARASQVGYEQGIRSPSVDYMCRLRALGVDINFVMFGVSSADFAVDNLDWELLGRIVIVTTNWCQSRGFEMKPEKFGEVLRILYNEHNRRPDTQELAVDRALQLFYE